jgi:hypothetical protein
MVTHVCKCITSPSTCSVDTTQRFALTWRRDHQQQAVKATQIWPRQQGNLPVICCQASISLTGAPGATDLHLAVIIAALHCDAANGHTEGWGQPMHYVQNRSLRMRLVVAHASPFAMHAAAAAAAAAAAVAAAAQCCCCSYCPVAGVTGLSKKTLLLCFS